MKTIQSMGFNQAWLKFESRILKLTQNEKIINIDLTYSKIDVKNFDSEFIIRITVDDKD